MEKILARRKIGVNRDGRVDRLAWTKIGVEIDYCEVRLVWK